VTGYTISQFLFPYQRSFVASLRYTAKAVFEFIGADEEPTVFLIGVAWPAIHLMDWFDRRGFLWG